MSDPIEGLLLQDRLNLERRTDEELEAELKRRKQRRSQEGFVEGFNLKALLVGDLNRLRYAQRYGTSLVLHPENVAEHTCFAALYSVFVAEWAIAKQPGIDISMEKLLYRAIFHDVDEAWSGDLPRPFKYSDQGLRKALSTASSQFVVRMAEEIMPKNAELIKKVSEAFEDAKDSDTYEGLILEFADFLAVLSHMWIESDFTNVTMAIHEETTRCYIERFDSGNFNFIRPLVAEAQAITLGILNRIERRRSQP